MQNTSTAFDNILDSIREKFGYPADLIRLLTQHPEIRVQLPEPGPSIAANSVVNWHELGESHVNGLRRDRGVLMGWRVSGGDYFSSFQIERSEYIQLGQREILTDWTCDITDVHGFSSSKSELLDFESTDAMVETNSRDMIDEISLAKLEKNLGHKDIRIIHSPNTSDHFVRYSWDGSLFLVNDGGSHHFAAAKYIAARLPKRVTLCGKLYTYSLNALAIASLRRDFEMFIISNEPHISNAFHDAMRSFKATWLWHHMPQAYCNTRAIILPRNEVRSMRVAAALREAGILDFGTYLANLSARQSTLASVTSSA